MKLSCSNENVLALAEQHGDTSVLYYLTDYSEGCKQEFTGKITGLKLDGDNLLCLVEETKDCPAHKKVDLYTFDLARNIVSSETVFELVGKCADNVSEIKSAMDEDFVYVVMVGLVSLSAEDNSFDPLDIMGQLAFVKIDIKTKQESVWDLADSLDAMDCIDEVRHIVNGFLIDINSLCISNGRLLLGCTAFDPDLQVGFDARGKNTILHSFEDTIQVCFDSKELASSSVQLQETWGKTPFSWLRFEEDVFNVDFLDGKIYVASSKGFYCFDGHATNMVCFSKWECSVDNPESYRYFHIWDGRLVFEIRDDKRLTGLLVCPASLEEPDKHDWLEVIFQ